MLTCFDQKFAESGSFGVKGEHHIVPFSFVFIHQILAIVHHPLSNDLIIFSVLRLKRAYPNRPLAVLACRVNIDQNQSSGNDNFGSARHCTYKFIDEPNQITKPIHFIFGTAWILSSQSYSLLNLFAIQLLKTNSTFNRKYICSTLSLARTQIGISRLS